jgi:uncharacterized protein (TIGR00730 family)|tara:strand:+ start:1368 stop:1949 length:582 start_codon:yes stop_codon:yes gene_type:complete
MANKIRTVAIYCGSNNGRVESYKQNATKLGKVLAKRKINLVYGGTNKGLMGVLANSAIEKGAHVTGVITERLKAKNQVHPNLSMIETYPTMQSRKTRMIELADACIMMPGGIGTLEEFMEVWTLNQLGETSKPLGILNINNYFENLIAFIEHMIAERFLPSAHRNGIVVNSDPEELINLLVEFSPVTVEKWLD